MTLITKKVHLPKRAEICHENGFVLWLIIVNNQILFVYIYRCKNIFMFFNTCEHVSLLYECRVHFCGRWIVSIAQIS